MGLLTWPPRAGAGAGVGAGRSQIKSNVEINQAPRCPDVDSATGMGVSGQRNNIWEPLEYF